MLTYYLLLYAVGLFCLTAFSKKDVAAKMVAQSIPIRGEMMQSHIQNIMDYKQYSTRGTRRLVGLLLMSMVFQVSTTQIAPIARAQELENTTSIVVVDQDDELLPDPVFEPAFYWNEEEKTQADQAGKLYTLPINEELDVVKVSYFTTTAYSSSVDETDDTPFIAADGTHVYWGMVATNVLPKKTKVRIPELYGDKVFVVHDRMNTRYNDINIMDIWHPSKIEAKQFGVKYGITIEILES